MGLLEIGEQFVNRTQEIIQDGVDVAQQTIRNLTGVQQDANAPQDADAMRLVSNRAVVSSNNNGATMQPVVSQNQAELNQQLQSARTASAFNAGGGTGGTGTTPGTTERVLQQTKNVTIKIVSTPAASDPGQPTPPPIERVVVESTTGDDQIKITRDPKTGATLINVNGEQHTFQTQHDNTTGGALVTIDGKQQQLARDDSNQLQIRAGDGNDTVEVGKGVKINLTISGGNGDDNIQGGDGDDILEGNAGNDTIKGGAGRNYINGGAGNDKLYGGTGRDVIYGGDGDDQLEGNAGDDYLEGGKGNDHLKGGAGRDVLSGGLDNDTLEGGANNDVIYAGGGTDQIFGGERTDKKSTGTDTVYAQKEDTVDKLKTTTTVNVELVGTPGSRSVRIEGSPEFVERVEQDIEMLRSSPNGRQMLAAFDKAYDSTYSPLSALPIFGGLFNNGNTVTIKELTEEANGFADWSRRTAGGPHPFLTPTGQPGASDDATISYNPRLNSLYSPNPNVAKDAWKYTDPVVVLYHEMSHSYNIVTGTFQNDTYTGTGPDSGVIANSERQAVGLPNSGVLFDNDFNPATPTSRDNPRAQTENGLREEMGRPQRPTYGDS